MLGLRQICNHFQRAVTLNSVQRGVAIPSAVSPSGAMFTSPIMRQFSSSFPRSFSTATNRDTTNNPLKEDLSKMSNEELADTSTIPGWDLIHSPPGKMPRGALVGTVVSTKMQKTINVSVDRYRIHPKVRKRIKYTRKFFAHDENEVANLGDLVMITPCHRISRHKHFLLRKIVRPKGQL